MQWATILLGSAWSQRAVIIATIIVYGYLLAKRPADARESAILGVRRFAGIFTLIVAALFLASAIGTLLPTELAERVLGGAAGIRGVVLAGLLGGLLPGGPYGAYPIIQGIYDQGASLAAVIAMITGYGAISTSRVAYGLVFFDAEVVGTRLAVGVLGTVFVAVLAGLILL